MPERIVKFLARSGVCSRREAEELIRQGRITVNGETVAAPVFLVDGTENIRFDGEKIKSKDKTRLWLYHKPAGLVTSHKDEKGRDTVFAHLPAGLPRVISVGRLDLNSEGLLLLTNDGGLSRALELPSNGWSRRYKVKVHGFLNERRLKKLEKGATVDGIAYGPCKITIDSRPKPAAAPVRNGNTAALPARSAASPSGSNAAASPAGQPVSAPVARGAATACGAAPVACGAATARTATNAWLTVSLTEGKNREIRKLMASVGLEVARLIRLSYGPFQLGSLKPGEVREVPQKTLREQLGSLYPQPAPDTARPPHPQSAPALPPAAPDTAANNASPAGTPPASPRSRNRTGGTTSCA